jgi:hypothetical protein
MDDRASKNNQRKRHKPHGGDNDYGSGGDGDGVGGGGDGGGGGVGGGGDVAAAADVGGVGGGVGSNLTGISAIENVFHFLEDALDLIAAVISCRRWREFVHADSLWRARFEREGMMEKARLFEVALPAVEGSSSSSGAAAAEHDEWARVGLTFYVQVFLLKVRVPCSLRS